MLEGLLGVLRRPKVRGMDKVILEGMTFYGYHGVSDAERELGQRFVVDVELAADLSEAGKSDDLAQTINYATVFRLVKQVVEGPPRRLIEALAEGVAALLLEETPAEEVLVRVRKPEAPIKGAVLDAAAVEIVRRRLG